MILTCLYLDFFHLLTLFHTLVLCLWHFQTFVICLSSLVFLLWPASQLSELVLSSFCLFSNHLTISVNYSPFYSIARLVLIRAENSYYASRQSCPLNALWTRSYCLWWFIINLCNYTPEHTDYQQISNYTALEFSSCKLVSSLYTWHF